MQGKVSPRYIVLALSMAMFFMTFYPVYANQIDQKQGELHGIQGQIDGAEGELKEIQAEERNLLNELNAIQNQLRNTQAEINALSAEIDDTENRIELKEVELAEAELRLQEREKFLETRLRAIYEYGEVTYMEVLFDSSSFSEFLTRFNDLQLIIEEDTKLLGEVREDRAKLIFERDQLEEDKENLLQMRVQNKEKKKALEVQTAEMAVIRAELNKQIKAQEQAIRNLEQEAKALEELINRLQAESRRASGEPITNLAWPMPGYGRNSITSNYGYRTNPITGKANTFHGGVDIGIPRTRWPVSPSYNGNPVQVVAAESGVVIFSGLSGSRTSGYGNLVIIDHGDGIATVYAHNHRLLVSKGEEVVRGQPVSIVGSTGWSTGPHLHFEVRVDGQRVNPMGYF